MKGMSASATRKPPCSPAPRGLHRDGDAVRQAVQELVGAEAPGRAGREQQPGDGLQEVLASGARAGTSHAEGSKRCAGFAAHEGSLTPWRTAVISARMAT